MQYTIYSLLKKHGGVMSNKKFSKIISWYFSFLPKKSLLNMI